MLEGRRNKITYGFLYVYMERHRAYFKSLFSTIFNIDGAKTRNRL